MTKKEIREKLSKHNKNINYVLQLTLLLEWRKTLNTAAVIDSVPIPNNKSYNRAKHTERRDLSQFQLFSCRRV